MFLHLISFGVMSYSAFGLKIQTMKNDLKKWWEKVSGTTYVV